MLSTRLQVHPPQGLPTGVHKLSLSSGPSTSNGMDVTLNRPLVPTLLMPPTVAAGKGYTA